MNKTAQITWYGPTARHEYNLVGPPTLKLHIWLDAYRSSYIFSKYGPESYKSGPGPKYYCWTCQLYIITNPRSRDPKVFNGPCFIIKISNYLYNQNNISCLWLRWILKLQFMRWKQAWPNFQVFSRYQQSTHKIKIKSTLSISFPCSYIIKIFKDIITAKQQPQPQQQNNHNCSWVETK